MQIAPVVDASSAQSRADVLTIGLSAVVLLTGLQWVSLQPRKPVQASCTLKVYIKVYIEHAMDASLRQLSRLMVSGPEL